MDIYRVRRSKKSQRMATLIEEFLGAESDKVDPLDVIKMEFGLKNLQKFNFVFDGTDIEIFENQSEVAKSSQRRTFNGYNAYSFLRDYLGIGVLPPYFLSAMESDYPKIPKFRYRRKGRISYKELDKIAQALLKFLKDTTFSTEDESD